MDNTPPWFFPIIGRGEWGETEDVNQTWNLHVINSKSTALLRTSHEHNNGGNIDLMSDIEVDQGWTHVGIVRNADRMEQTFYVNGQRAETMVFASNATGGWNTSGYIGWAPWGVTTFFDGSIDDIRVFARMLSDEEMAELFEENGWIVDVAEDGSEGPGTFSLAQNYPNPFNPKTTIAFSIPHQELVTISIYDVLGREILTPLNASREGGVHSVHVNMTGQSSGIYFYRIDAGAFSETRRLLLLR